MPEQPPPRGAEHGGGAVEGEQLPEEVQPGHPHAASTPERRAQTRSAEPARDGSDPPATGNPKQTPP